MESFVLAGKARTVFQLIEMKAKREMEEAARKALEKKKRGNK